MSYTANGKRFSLILPRSEELPFYRNERVGLDNVFHIEDVRGQDLEEGQDVEFVIESSLNRPRAGDLQRFYSRVKFPFYRSTERLLYRIIRSASIRTDRAWVGAEKARETYRPFAAVHAPETPSTGGPYEL